MPDVCLFFYLLEIYRFYVFYSAGRFFIFYFPGFYRGIRQGMYELRVKDNVNTLNHKSFWNFLIALPTHKIKWGLHK